jgi:hypothetical protein
MRIMMKKFYNYNFILQILVTINAGLATEGSRQTIVVCRCEGEVRARSDFPGR